MQTKNLALGVALALVAAAAFAGGAADRHPSRSSSSGSSSSGSSGGSAVSSSSGSSNTPSTPSSGSSYSASSHRSGASSARSSSRGHRGGSSTARRGGDHRGGSIRVYGHYASPWGYDPYYGGYYGGYYDGYYGYGWRGAYPGYRYAYNTNYGSLRIMVQPDDTEVYVDGYFAGEVDAFNGIFQRLNVRPGRHEITLKRAGYRTHRLRVYVPVGSTMRIRHDMERGANLQPTETVIGSPQAGETLERESVDAQGDDTQAPEEPEAPVRPGELRLNVKPADAAVYVDGVFRGNADDVEELQLPPGTHRIEVVRPGYVTYERDVTLRSGQNVDQRVELTRTARQQ